MHPSHGGRTLRYRHVADERWDLGAGALGVLAMLILRGPETEATLRARAERFLDAGGSTIEEALDELMARRPDPFVHRLAPGPGERESRYEQLLATPPSITAEAPADEGPTDDGGDPPPGEVRVLSNGVGSAPPDDTSELIALLVDEVTELRRRVERLERLFDG